MNLLRFALATMLVVTACGGAATAPSPAPIATPAPAPTQTPMVKTMETSLGRVLVESQKGMTLYTWDKDGFAASQCYDACATVWPPFLATEIKMAPGTIMGTLTLVARKDSTKQVSYNNQPLYFYRSDVAAGDVKGQGSQGFGALWAVVKNP